MTLFSFCYALIEKQRVDVQQEKVFLKSYLQREKIQLFIEDSYPQQET